MKTNDFVLPEKWCVKHYPETLEWIRNNAEHNGASINEASYYYYPCDASYSNYSNRFPFGGYIEITFDQFKEHVLGEVKQTINLSIFNYKTNKYETTYHSESWVKPIDIKKIIGYKLIKPEYKEAVRAITGLKGFSFSCFEKEGIERMEWSVDTLKTAGVMHWFEEVYEKQTITLKSGVKLSEDDIAEVKEILNNK